SLLKAAPPAKALPSQRLTLLPAASVVTKVLSRASFTRWASIVIAWSQLSVFHSVALGARYMTFSTRLAETASCIALAPLGQSRPSFTGLSGLPSIWSSLPLSFVYAISEQPTAQ